LGESEALFLECVLGFTFVLEGGVEEGFDAFGEGLGGKDEVRGWWGGAWGGTCGGAERGGEV